LRIDVPSLPIQVKSAYACVYAQVGKWANYTVKWIDEVSLYLQNPLLAGSALVVLNMVFFEVALVICRLIHHVLNQRVNDEVLPESERSVRQFGLGVVFVTTLGISNWICCKMLHLPLSKWKVIALSLSTGLFYLLRKIKD
jgi:hypothetical protein